MDGQAKVSLILELKEKLKSGLAKAKSMVNDNVRDIKDRLKDLQVSHVEAFSQMKGSIPGLSSAIDAVSNPYVMLTAVVVGLGAAFGKASGMAQEFDSRMAHANVTANESKRDLQKTGNTILGIAADSTTKDAANAAPDAYNILLSSGMDKTNALNTVKPTLDAAKAGFTDIAVVARAAAASMNSSGIKDATKVYDILFATLNKGNAEFADVAQYLPKIIPQAMQVGSSFQEVAGAFAYFTAQGQTSERAATLLENAFKSLSDPDKRKNFHAIGVELYDQHGKLNSLVTISKELNTALNGLTDKQRGTVLKSLGLDMDSAAAFAGMTKDVKALDDSIKFTTNSAGQAALAFENAKTPMDGWSQVSNMIDVGWIKLGQTVNSVIGPIANLLINHKTLLKDIAIVVLSVATAWGAYTLATNAAAIAANTLKGVMWLLNTAMDANPIGLIVTGIGVLVGTFAALTSNIDSATTSTDKLKKSLTELMHQSTDNATKDLENIAYRYQHGIKGFDKGGNAINYSIKEQNEGIEKGIKDQIRLFTEAHTAVKNGVSITDFSLEDMAYINKLKSYGKPTTTTKDLYGHPNASVQKVLDKADKKDKKGDSDGRIQAGQPRTVNIHIDEVIAGDFVTKNEQFGAMGPKEFEKWFTEMLMRLRANSEMGYN